MEQAYYDGIPICDDCGGGLCQARLPECNNPNHRDVDLIPPFTPSDVEHTWQNWLDHEPPYVCKCGQEFNLHSDLMDHTAEFNPSVSTLDMGRAGVSVEREAHENTLALLKRARNIFMKQQYGSVKGGLDEEIQSLLVDIKEQCLVFAEEDEKEFEELLDKQIARGEFLKENGREVADDD